jgi:PD-(D/E)XK nuclease superfamily protein
VHRLYEKADKLSREIIGAAMEVHRHKGLVFDEPLRFDILVDDCLLVELKAVEILHLSSKAQLFSYMKLLDIPVGLLINFHEPILKNGISRMILPGANRKEENESTEISL